MPKDLTKSPTKVSIKALAESTTALQSKILTQVTILASNRTLMDDLDKISTAFRDIEIKLSDPDKNEPSTLITLFKQNKKLYEEIAEKITNAQTWITKMRKMIAKNRLKHAALKAPRKSDPAYKILKETIEAAFKHMDAQLDIAEKTLSGPATQCEAIAKKLHDLANQIILINAEQEMEECATQIQKLVERLSSLEAATAVPSSRSGTAGTPSATIKTFLPTLQIRLQAATQSLSQTARNIDPAHAAHAAAPPATGTGLSGAATGSVAPTMTASGSATATAGATAVAGPAAPLGAAPLAGAGHQQEEKKEARVALDPK